MILILANKWDLTVDLVVLELQRRQQRFVRLNTEDLPAWSASIRFPAGELSLLNAGISLVSADLTAIWSRRLGHVFDDYPKPDRPSDATQRFITDQWFAWLDGLQLRSEVLWVNHPAANARMESKVRQLHLAQQVGFPIPETLITNDVETLQSWLRDLRDRAVCKALYSPLIEEPEQDWFIFTNILDSVPNGVADALRLAPVIFQRALSPKLDYRVTVVGDRVFTVRITVADAVIDWRTAKNDVDLTVCRLPPEVEDRCRRFVRTANLQFGAIDLVESGSDYYFLEVNPNGEWGWLQRPHGVPIASALADLLLSKS